ncbi:MAG: hypothetical protein WEE89_20560 [Gemmatimonadota bacterium]
MKASAVVATLSGAATAPGTNQAGACEIASAAQALPAEVRETSGLARGRSNTDILWTHNDKGNTPDLFALGPDGKIRSRVRVTNARISDWEDIEAGACGTRNCLYIADIGDNSEGRAGVVIYEVLEPQLPANQTTVLSTINARYADGAQDAEALFRLPNGEFYVVTKGRKNPIKLYHLSAAAVNGQRILQPVRELAQRPRRSDDRITAATASPDGNFVAIRSYSTLTVYRTPDLLEKAGAPFVTYALTPLGQKQGESIVLENDGSVWLSSEAEQLNALPSLARLRCNLR